VPVEGKEEVKVEFNIYKKPLATGNAWQKEEEKLLRGSWISGGQWANKGSFIGRLRKPILTSPVFIVQ